MTTKFVAADVEPTTLLLSARTTHEVGEDGHFPPFMPANQIESFERMAAPHFTLPAFITLSGVPQCPRGGGHGWLLHFPCAQSLTLPLATLRSVTTSHATRAPVVLAHRALLPRPPELLHAAPLHFVRRHCCEVSEAEAALRPPDQASCCVPTRRKTAFSLLIWFLEPVQPPAPLLRLVQGRLGRDFL